MGFFDNVFDPPFRRRRNGRYSVNLSPEERHLIEQLVVQLRELLGTDSTALRRLFPPPYGDDEERNQGYAVLAGSELIERRLAALDLVSSTLQADELDEEQVEAWMRCINDIRLVLGTMLDVTEDGDDPDPEDPQAPIHAAYEYLGMLLERIVRSLAG
ncbi:MAG: DUF2017 family protein [Microthrixaceae bacterium]